MTDIKLVNKNGTIVGVDPGTDEEIPIELDEASIGGGVPYNLVSNEHTTVTVNSDGSADYASIQAAVDDAPKYLRHEYVIDVQNGHDESVGGTGHVHIEAVHHVNSADGSEGFTADGDHGLLRIQGNRTDPSQCKVNTLSAFGCTGVQSPTLLGLEFSGDQNPDVDEACCVSFDGCTEAFVADCSILDSGVSPGLQAYRSFLHMRDTSIDTTTAMSLKRQSHGQVQGMQGTWTDAAGLTIGSTFRSDATVSGTEIKWSSQPRGEAYFRASGGLYFPRGWATWNPDNLTFVHDTDSSSGAFQFRDFNADVMRFKIDGKGWGNSHIENLSGQTGDFDGQVRLDDGTNTANRGIPCTWDNDGSQWVPHDGSATFS